VRDLGAQGVGDEIAQSPVLVDRMALIGELIERDQPRQPSGERLLAGFDLPGAAQEDIEGSGPVADL